MAPCHEARARRLLSSGKAAVFRAEPFTIILNREVEDEVRPFPLKTDPGIGHTGVSLVREIDVPQQDGTGKPRLDVVLSETDLVVNLASREYSRAVEPFLPGNVRFLTCTFGEEQGGRVVEKGARCKMARGEMVRWMAQRGITRAEDLKNFAELDYRFVPSRSSDRDYVFLKGGA